MATATTTAPVLPTSSPSQPVDVEKPSNSSSSSSDGAASPPRTSIRTFLLTHVDVHLSWIPLIISSLVSGLNDASAFAAWGSFTDMQTGNTIFLALGASGQPISPPFAWLKGLVAICSFILACFVLPRIQRLFSPAGTTRIGLFVSWFIQGACLIIAGALVQSGVAPEPLGRITPADMNPTADYFIELAPIAFMAFQAGGQITTARMLGFNEIPTVVLTSLYCDLASDASVFKLKNAKRDRRVMSAVALLVGGIAGGWLSRSNARMSSVLWIGAFLKLACSVAYLFWPAKAEAQKK